MELKKKNYIKFQLTEPLKKTLNFFINELKSILKVEEVILFFLDSSENLHPYSNNNNVINNNDWEIVEYFFTNQENIYINLNSPLAKKFHLENPVIIYNLSSPEGEIGLILIKGYKDKLFFETDFHIVKNIFASFSLLINGALQYKNNIFIPFNNSLLLLLENSHLIRLYQDIEKKLYSLLEVSNIINSSKKLEDMIQNILESATKVLRAESASVFLVDIYTGELVFDIITGDSNLKGIRIPKGKGIVGKCAETRQSFIVNDPSSDPDFYQDVDKISQMTTRNLMACPLIVNNEVIGVIEVINTIDRSEFTKEDLELFQSFSDSVAIALQRRRLMDYIEEANLQLEQKVRELTTLHKIAQILVEHQDIGKIAELVLSTIQSELKITRLSFVIYDTNLKKFRLLSHKGYNLNQWELSPKLIQYVFERKIPLYIKNFDEIPELKPYISPERYITKSAILIPLLKSNGKPFGILCATDPENKDFLETEDFKLLSTIGSQISKTYESIEYTGIQKEIEITARIQKNILPSKLPVHKSVLFFAKTIPAKTTGGDFFDYYIESPYGNCFFMIADVSGKSLPAALFMAIANSIIRTVMRQEEDPAKILSYSNDLLFEESESGMFVTVFLAKYNAISGTLEYASAGHNNMLLIHDDNTYEILSAKGLPLGVLRSKDVVYEKKVINLKKNDILVLYTDGVTESINNQDIEYGLERLIKQIILNKQKSPQNIINHIYNDVLTFINRDIPDDDFTLLISKFSLKFIKDEFTIILPARKESVPKLIKEIDAILSRYKIPENILHDILLVCDEIATNICLYAYKNKEISNPQFKCKIKIQDRTLFITFIDNGNQYDFYGIQKPDLIKNLMGEKEGGFGLFLVHTLMDKAIYSHKKNKNFLTIVKSI
ncbi:MAG: serine phosphatase [Leptospiraceae bacterium]|nr:MAG: serine phosphatase [Leptospiraceae bacterium]